MPPPKKRSKWGRQRAGPIVRRMSAGRWGESIRQSTAEYIDLCESNLYPGGLFVVNTDLCVVDDKQKKHEPQTSKLYPQLFRTIFGHAIAVPHGAIAIYAGQARIEEACGRRTLRHSFIINCCRYFLSDLSTIDPVVNNKNLEQNQS